METSIGRVIAEKGMLLAPGVCDALSACLARQAWFEVIFVSAYSVATGRLGISDIALRTRCIPIPSARTWEC